MAGPVFSGPGSRAATERSHQSLINTATSCPGQGDREWGPAPTGPTTALPLRSWSVSMKSSVRVGVGGSGVRAQAPIRGRPGGQAKKRG